MSLPFPMSNTLPQIVTTPAVITTTSQYSSNNDSPLIGQVSVTTKATSTPITSLSTSIIVATATTLSVPATSSSNIPVTTVNKCTTANSITLTSLTSSTSCSSSSLAAISSVTVPSTTRPLPSPKSREEALSIAGKFHFASRNSQVPLYVSEDIVLRYVSYFALGHTFSDVLKPVTLLLCLSFLTTFDYTIDETITYIRFMRHHFWKMFESSLHLKNFGQVIIFERFIM